MRAPLLKNLPPGGKVTPKGPDEGIVQEQASLEKLCRAREGELPRRGKRSWPGPRPRRAVLQGDFAACGRRPSFSMAKKKAKRHRGRGRWTTAPPRSIGPLSPEPILRELPLEAGRTVPARKIRSAWMRFLSGHWALSLQKLPLLRFHSCAWVVRFRCRGAQCAPAGRPPARRTGSSLYPL